jgi:hypothetical protein
MKKAHTEKITEKQHLLLAIRAALVTGEDQSLCQLVKEYRTIQARTHIGVRKTLKNN